MCLQMAVLVLLGIEIKTQGGIECSSQRCPAAGGENVVNVHLLSLVANGSITALGASAAMPLGSFADQRLPLKSAEHAMGLVETVPRTLASIEPSGSARATGRFPVKQVQEYGDCDDQ